MVAADRIPSHAELVDDLGTLREKGLTQLRRLRLVALARAAQFCDLAEGSDVAPAAIEALLRQAVERLSGARLGEAAAYTLGLIQGTKDWPAQDRRAEVARLYGVTPDRARKAQEKTALEQTAEEILNLCQEHRMRDTRMQMERRLPAESRLAVAWVERFEAYYRIWTPIDHLANDLRASYETRREADPGHAPWDPSEPWLGPEGQARNYARFALYAYAAFKLELKKFMSRHGGLWLLSDQHVESEVADAVYRIGWHNPINEEQDSWLRQALTQTQGEEQRHFNHLLTSSPTGEVIHERWQKHVASCTCPSDDEPIATCQVHSTIRACDDYLRIIDEDWDRIADWYRPGERRPPKVNPDVLYRKQVEGRGEPNAQT